MHIDWAQTQVYNTLMSVATGVGLILLVRFFWLINQGNRLGWEGWSIGFAIPGFILTFLGGAMTITWPLSKIGFPFDDIIFGEPSLAFGVLLLGASILVWRKSNQVMRAEEKGKESNEQYITSIFEMFRPMSYFSAAMGLALFSVAVAGVYYQLFAAPPEEPISGQFADYPMLEAVFVSMLYALTGLGAVMLPFSLANRNSLASKIMIWCWSITGVLFTLFGAMNYFTHIGLIINTM